MNRKEYEWTRTNLRYCPGIWSDRLRNITNKSLDNRCPGRDSNETPAEYKSETLQLELTYSLTSNYESVVTRLGFRHHKSTILISSEATDTNSCHRSEKKIVIDRTLSIYTTLLQYHRQGLTWRSWMFVLKFIERRGFSYRGYVDEEGDMN
jgi:hypothetical protein